MRGGHAEAARSESVMGLVAVQPTPSELRYVEGFLHHLAIFIKYKNRVLTPLKTIKIGREPCKTEFFECSFRSPRDGAEKLEL